MITQPIKAAFFDRDGTLIEGVNYLSRLEDVRLIPASIAIARQCQQLGYKIFVVTNQSGIARGFFDEAFVLATHALIADQCTDQGVLIEKFYFCPHHPTKASNSLYQQDCRCRKPLPGMLLQAAQEYNIDLSASLMFGDRQSDWDAGRAAGCRSFDISSLFALPIAQCVTLIQT